MEPEIRLYVKKAIKHYGMVLLTAIFSGIFGFFLYPNIRIKKLMTDNPERLVMFFYKVLFVLALSIGTAIIVFFLVMYAISVAKNSKQEDVYKIFQHKGFIL